MWSHVICESLTGRPLLRVFPSDFSCKSGKAPTSMSTHTFETKARRGLTESMWVGLVEPWSRAIVTCWNGVPQYAGLIQEHDFDPATGELIVEHDELSRIMLKRLVTGQDPFTRDGFFGVAGLSDRSAISAVIQRATQGAPGYNFPITGFLPPAPGGVTRQWPFYEFAKASDMLADLVNADNAPDVYFRPRWSSQHWLEWSLEIGTPHLPGPTVEWVVGAPKTPALGLKVRTSGRPTNTGIIAVGKGTEHDTVLGFAGGLGTFPVRLDETRMHKSVDDPAILDSLAMGELRTIEKPVKQIRITSAPAELALPNVRVGTRIRALGQPGGFVGAAAEVEVIGVSFTPSATIGLETQ